MNRITPQEFLRIETEQLDIIEKAQDVIDKARKSASKCPLPKNLRPATASDIILNNVIWYPPNKYRRDFFWLIVEEVLWPDDPFKAFTYQGSRYGLDGAFVEA